jgi:hypothetical protein
MVGIAPNATFLLAKTEDVRSETPLEEDTFVAALEWADSLGADLVSSSLGYLGFDDGSGYAPEELDGDIAVTTRAADSAVARGIVVISAMGNEGPAARTLITPADGDSVLGIGAEDSTGRRGFARAPYRGQSRQPDFIAPGGHRVAFRVACRSPPQRDLLRHADPTGAPSVPRGPSRLRPHRAPGAAGNATSAPPRQRARLGPPDARTTVYPKGLVMTESGDTQTSVAPLHWTVPDAPGFARPFTFQLRVTRERRGLTCSTRRGRAWSCLFPWRGVISCSSRARRRTRRRTAVSPALPCPRG